jgi:p-methyltransferase
MSGTLDCIVVGYNDTPFSELLARTQLAKDHSGGYHHLKANSLEFRGERIKYSDLINTCISASTGKESRHHVGRLPNLGACYLASFLRKRGLRAEVVNFFNHDKDRLEQLLAESPRAVAITTTFYFEFGPIREIVDFIRRYNSETRIVVGGPYVFNTCSDYPPAVQDTLFKQTGADIFVFDSQGELTLSRIVSQLGNQRPDLGAIPNLVYASNGGAFHRTGREIENNDMDANAVDWSTFDTDFLRPAVQTRTARSCAFKCAFCRYPVLAGDLDLTSLEVIERELDYLHASGVTHLLFIDDTFNIPAGRFKQICRLLIRKKYDFKWFSYFRCANADEEAFDLMAEAGCTGVFLGIESGDQAVLKAMNKAATVERYKWGLRQLNSRGIVSYASFIIGFPGETEESARNTMSFVQETQPTFYCLESYFHDRKVPIAEKTDLYEIKGQAYSWKHKSMDWSRAAELVEEGYRTITGSSILPLYSFDLWSLAYFMSQGFPIEQLTRFLELSSEMLVKGLGEATPAYGDLENRILSVFGAPNQKPPSLQAVS